jgi:crotonobetainyl-CoA:carnitine CoA-transferase CaiB-like acyl-CoA transferase
MPQVGTGILLDGEPALPRSTPPRLGEHTDEVLGELLGLDDNAQRKLQEKNIIERKDS